MVMLLLGTFLLQFVDANSVCHQRNFPYIGAHAMKTCIAQCLELNTKLRSCNFSAKTGKAKGDPCTDQFEAVDKEKIISCQYDHPTFKMHSKVLEKVCDLVIMDGLLKWDKSKRQLVEADSYLEATAPFRKRAVASKIKLWLHLGADIESDIRAQDWSDLTADPDQRKRLITRISVFLTQYKMDGVYIEWRFPGCPDKKMGSSQSQRDKSSSLAFLKELAQALQPDEKVIATYASLVNIEFLRCLGADYQQNVIKYVNFTVLDGSGQNGLWKPTMELTRNIQNMESLMKNLFALYGSGLKNKAILKTVMVFYEFALLDPTKNTILSRYNMTASNGFVPMQRICAILKSGAFKKVVDAKMQRYAYSATHWIPLEDMEHVQLEVERLIKKFGLVGFHMEMIQYDDLEGDCGSGKLPFLRMHAEALKGGACIFKPFL